MDLYIYIYIPIQIIKVKNLGASRGNLNMGIEDEPLALDLQEKTQQLLVIFDKAPQFLMEEV